MYVINIKIKGNKQSQAISFCIYIFRLFKEAKQICLVLSKDKTNSLLFICATLASHNFEHIESTRKIPTEKVLGFTSCFEMTSTYDGKK